MLAAVSVLFSEPKIPQCFCNASFHRQSIRFQCSSASRKFLNQISVYAALIDAQRFQCSSASRKFLNSARSEQASAPSPFQCSSASRKFLNRLWDYIDVEDIVVSVLFSEPKIPQFAGRTGCLFSRRVSVLFSEPKIPQWKLCRVKSVTEASFSALQRAENSSIFRRRVQPQIEPASFSALQRAENSSIRRHRRSAQPLRPFQCSSASRKFLNRQGRHH